MSSLLEIFCPQRRRDAIAADLAWNHEQLAYWTKALVDNEAAGYETAVASASIKKYEQRIENNVTRYTQND